MNRPHRNRHATACAHHGGNRFVASGPGWPGSTWFAWYHATSKAELMRKNRSKLKLLLARWNWRNATRPCKLLKLLKCKQLRLLLHKLKLHKLVNPFLINNQRNLRLKSFRFFYAQY